MTFKGIDSFISYINEYNKNKLRVVTGELEEYIGI